MNTAAEAFNEGGAGQTLQSSSMDTSNCQRLVTMLGRWDNKLDWMATNDESKAVFIVSITITKAPLSDGCVHNTSWLTMWRGAMEARDRSVYDFVNAPQAGFVRMSDL